MYSVELEVSEDEGVVSEVLENDWNGIGEW